MSATYRITHQTEYVYETAVTSSYGQLHMLPRDTDTQRCRHGKIAVDPSPDLFRERVDFFGNRVNYFALHNPHTLLSVMAVSEVEVDERGDALSLFADRSWEGVRDYVRAGGDQIPEDIVQYMLDSPRLSLAADYREYAQMSFTAGAGMLEALRSLSSRIHADFEYVPGSTSVATPLEDAFAARRGVCQDFAHLGIACLRSLGLPARYVSGYLETDPPPGRPKLTGADGSHAWLSVFVPGSGWIDLDPTNNQFVGGRHIVTALGRDYGDVPPMNGVIYTQGRTERLEVKVDVVAL